MCDVFVKRVLLTIVHLRSHTSVDIQASQLVERVRLLHKCSLLRIQKLCMLAVSSVYIPTNTDVKTGSRPCLDVREEDDATRDRDDVIISSHEPAVTSREAGEVIEVKVESEAASMSHDPDGTGASDDDTPDVCDVRNQAETSSTSSTETVEHVETSISTYEDSVGTLVGVEPEVDNIPCVSVASRAACRDGVKEQCWQRRAFHDFDVLVSSLRLTPGDVFWYANNARIVCLRREEIDRLQVLIHVLNCV